MNFLQNFDPEKSAREQRKMSRKSYFMGKPVRRKALYNDRGTLLLNGKDLCDCLEPTCPGCHFPCPKCGSIKCGPECRSYRKWMYEKIEIEGSDFVIKNEYVEHETPPVEPRQKFPKININQRITNVIN